MTRHGSCLCGAVAFRIEGAMEPVAVCHCGQCRRFSGHVWASGAAPADHVQLIRSDGLAWVRSSPEAERGFCRSCGAALFWRETGANRLCIAPGALDSPTGLQITRDIFTKDAGDYATPASTPDNAPDSPPTTTQAPETLRGACLCGAVTFSLPGPMGAVTACHCTQCRKLSGHFAASFDAPEASVILHGRATITQYTTPGGGQRGFCSTCGSSLWFRAANGAFSIEAGCITAPTSPAISSLPTKATITA